MVLRFPAGAIDAAARGIAALPRLFAPAQLAMLVQDQSGDWRSAMAAAGAQPE
jgi:hypothetical protein